MNTEKLIGSRFVADVIVYRSLPSFRPMVTTEDPLVHGRESVRLLQTKAGSPAIKPGEHWLVEVAGYKVLRINADEYKKDSADEYKKDSKGRPMVILNVLLIGKIRSYLQKGEWITIAKGENEDVLLSQVPAKREEVYLPIAEDGKTAAVERVLVGEEVVRERYVTPPTKSFYQKGSWVTNERWANEEREISREKAERRVAFYLHPQNSEVVVVVEMIHVGENLVRERISQEIPLEEYLDYRYDELAGLVSRKALNVLPETLPERLR